MSEFSVDVRVYRAIPVLFQWKTAFLEERVIHRERVNTKIFLLLEGRVH